MENYSVTQTTNIAAFAGVLVLILGHFHIIVAAEDITTLLGGIVAFGSIVYNFYNRYSKGDINALGKRI